VTVRFGPTRPELAPKPDDRMQSEPLFQAIEALQPGDFLAIDCGGDLTGGTVGDILAARMKRLGAAGLLIDGAVRDIGQIREFVGLPVWARGAQGSGYQPYLACLERDRPVRCFGVTVLPGDYLVADEDGAVAVPAALAQEIATAGLEVERKESFIRGLVEQGASTREVYPPNAQTLERYEAAKQG
jgi:regulator of RNase E activity RraA